MSDSRPTSRASGFAWESHPRTYRRLAALLVTAIITFSVAPVYNNLHGDHNKDYNLWYWSGRTYLEGSSLYPTDDRPFPFMYPPTAAVGLALASVFGERPFLAILLLGNALAWIGAIFLSVKLATGSALRQRPLLYLVPSVWAIPFISDMFLLGQPNLLLLTLILGAFAALCAPSRRSRGHPDRPGDRHQGISPAYRGLPDLPSPLEGARGDGHRAGWVRLGSARAVPRSGGRRGAT